MSKSKASANAITPRREEDFPEWYQAVITAADMAENSEVRGCMVIKPWGYGIWELMQSQLDRMFKATGHKNAYFPLFIPLSYLEKEAEHVAGFAKECAVVTHHRLEVNAEGKLVPTGPLTEPLVVRPTSETIIGAAYARWVQSYRDLPVLLNQWANVVRWEMRPRVFLRTTEFLWQEGHTAHETEQEALHETRRMLDVYETFARDHLAIPVVTGRKSASERFPGAVDTLCIEAMVQDRKAVQAGTSHFLGQNFAKASGIKYLSRAGKQECAWTTSWGVSTRLIGALVMAHADDDGLVLPPRVAPVQVVIIPIIPRDEQRKEILKACGALAQQIEAEQFHQEHIRVEVDQRDTTGGHKTWEWIKKGVPVRVEIGPRDLEAGTVFVGRRDRGPKEKQSYPKDGFAAQTPALLQSIQESIYGRAQAFRHTHTRMIESKEEFYAFFTPKDEEKPEIHGGFALAHWNGSAELEAQIKEDLKVTIRCLPFEEMPQPGKCIFTGEKSEQRVIFAKSY
ncbi:MAG TPA: proline--tRNA ligase [Candidatus Methylacidiphilales bacterium]|nr:proline--tRNA ligase [Candidatus Methylacidiphilales bacterium]